MTDIQYAIVGGPPVDWRGLQVIDLDTGKPISRVIEVDAAQGWLRRYREDEQGMVFIDPAKPDEAAQERIEGRFQIVRSL